MKIGFLALALAFSSLASAQTMKMNYNNEEITKIIETFSKNSGQKFVVDPGVRGKISIFINDPVPMEEAFHQLSNALAVNGYALSKQDDTWIVGSARNIQRNLIQVSKTLPALKPQRMATWVYTFQNVPAEDVNRELRILTSKDGEMTVLNRTNQVVISDWTSNLQRIAEIFKEIDRPVEPGIAKLVQGAEAEKNKRRAMMGPPEGKGPEGKGMHRHEKPEAPKGEGP